MRTTLRLDESLLQSVKGYAARHRRTVTSVMEDALRRLLEEERAREATAAVDVVVFTGSGLRPGIDLTESSTWKHVLDEEDAVKLQARDADS